jgi:hypothetical protein
MKNVRLAIFVIGTTIMLWLGCSKTTADESALQVNRDYSLLETGMEEPVGDSLSAESLRTMDELDERE